MRKFIIVCAAAFALSACVNGQAVDLIDQNKTLEENVNSIGEFTLADIDHAMALTAISDDKKAQACYPTLRKWVADIKAKADAALPSGPNVERVDGVVTAYQRARNVRILIQKGPPEELVIACSAMVNDSTNFLNSLFRRIGVKAVIPAL